MLRSAVYPIPIIILFATYPIFLPSVSAQNDSEVTCISNYAELKQSLFENGTGNMERLLYAFTAPNLPLPHYIWVHYYHNQSSDWSDILTCPPSQALHRCPIDNEDTNRDDNGDHIVFWADSAMLINLDIPLLKTLSYNSILQYLGSGTCVQLAISPFCESVDSNSEREIIKFATSYLRSYSTSSEESERDYVLHCDDKFGTEFEYDAFLLCSEFIVCVGSGVLFAILSLNLCSIKKYSKSSGSGEESREKTAKEDILSAKELFGSCKTCNFVVVVDATFEGHKTFLSAVLIFDITAISFLITDAVQFSLNPEIMQEAFWYGYGTLNIILFGTVCLAMFIGIPLSIISLIIFCIVKCFPEATCFGRTPFQNKMSLIYTVVLNTALTLVSFIYILSRAFLITLAIATYPFEVGFILLAIGSGFVALMFVIWAAVHIAVDSYNAKVKLFSTIISLIPYGSLLIILTGFLVSYIYVILRLNIRLGDPITSLVAALVPTLIGFVAANRYKSERKNISGMMQEDGKTQDIEATLTTNKDGTQAKGDLDGAHPSDMSMSPPASAQQTAAKQSPSDKPSPTAPHTNDIVMRKMNKCSQADMQSGVAESYT